MRPSMSPRLDARRWSRSAVSLHSSRVAFDAFVGRRSTVDGRRSSTMVDMEGVESAAAGAAVEAATAAVEAARAVTARIEGGERAGGRAEGGERGKDGEARAMEEDGNEDDGRRRRGRGGRRVSVLDRLGKTNQPTSSPSRRRRVVQATREDSGRDATVAIVDFDGMTSTVSAIDGFEAHREASRRARGLARRDAACDAEKRADGVVVARAFGAEIIQVSATGEVSLRRPVDEASGAPRCDTEVLNAFNSCLNKFGFTASASPADQTQWSLSDGKRLSRFSDGMIVPARTRRVLVEAWRSVHRAGRRRGAVEASDAADAAVDEDEVRQVLLLTSRA